MRHNPEWKNAHVPFHTSPRKKKQTAGIAVHFVPFWRLFTAENFDIRCRRQNPYLFGDVVTRIDIQPIQHKPIRQTHLDGPFGFVRREPSGIFGA